MSEGDVKLPFGKIDWSLQLVHTTGSLVDYRKNWERDVEPHNKNLSRLLDVLHPILPPEQGKYAVFGCFAANSYNVPRETQDVDVAAVVTAFDSIETPLRVALEPEGFEFRRISGQTFVHHGKEKLCDLVFAETDPVLLAALKHPRGTRFIHVPRLGDAWCVSPEAFIVSKFYAASEARRDTKRFQDVFDMLSTLRQKENQPLDAELMRKFAGFVPFMGARETFEDILAAVAAGLTPKFPWGDDRGFREISKLGPATDGS